MSYSFTIQAGSKDEARERLASAFDTVVASQPVHVADRDAAQTNAEAVLNVLADPNDEQKISGSVSGYVSWSSENHFTSVNISASFSLAPKE